MQTLNLSGLNKVLHPDRDKRTATERIASNLGSSNLGLHKNTATGVSTMDSFTITKNISELLSPACGMTDEEKQQYMSRIMAKLKSGKKLTAEEMRFLQAEDPVLYQQAARVQSLRDSFESRLKSCTSKEGAAQAFSDAMSSVSDKDPMKEYITAAYQDAYKEFQEDDGYKALPQTEEEAKGKKNETQSVDI